MFFSGTQGQLYVRSWKGRVASYPSGDWTSKESYRRYISAITDGDKFNDPDNFIRVGSVQSWSLNGTQSVIDCTTLGDSDSVFTQGVKGATGNARVLYYASVNKLGNAGDRATDKQNAINKLAARFFKTSRYVVENGGPGVTGFQRTYDDGVGSMADPMLFRFMVVDSPNGSLFTETPTLPADSNNINIDVWAHITGFNLNMAVGEVFSADLSFTAIGCPTVVDL